MITCRVCGDRLRATRPAPATVRGIPFLTPVVHVSTGREGRRSRRSRRRRWHAHAAVPVDRTPVPELEMA